MSFFSWFSGKSSRDRTFADNDRAGLTRDERTRPVAGARAKASVKTVAEQGDGQKSKRHAKRELLYVAVREAMIRAGVLSASYKFKVLSLDPRGDQFMVMMDLAQEFGRQTERLAEIEVMIAQNAKSRYNIRVTAVYWRMNEMVSIGRPKPSASARGSELPGAGAAAVLPPSPAVPVPAVATAPVGAHYEPILADEVAAFRQALAAASASGTSVVAERASMNRGASPSYTLLTGFEDTEMPPEAAPALSTTQYGDLI